MTDETATGPEERYIFMVCVSLLEGMASKADYDAQATGEPFDLKSVVFKSAKLSPCLKVIKVKLDWPDNAEATR